MDKVYYNFIAQEFRSVFPNSVTQSGETLPDNTGTILQINTHPVDIYLVKAVQELKTEKDRMVTEQTVALAQITARKDLLAAAISTLQKNSTKRRVEKWQKY